jgi:hypothetical protein
LCAQAAISAHRDSRPHPLCGRIVLAHRGILYPDAPDGRSFSWRAVSAGGCPITPHHPQPWCLYGVYAPPSAAWLRGTVGMPWHPAHDQAGITVSHDHGVARSQRARDTPAHHLPGAGLDRGRRLRPITLLRAAHGPAETGCACSSSSVPPVLLLVAPFRGAIVCSVHSSCPAYPHPNATIYVPPDQTNQPPSIHPPTFPPERCHHT